MDTSKCFYTEEDIKYWNRLPRVVVKSPSLKGFKTCRLVLRDTVL